MKNIFFLSLISLILFSCGGDSLTTGPYEIATKIYGVKGSGTEFEKDTLQMIEIEHFDKDQKLIKKEFFDQNEQLTGIQTYVYENNSSTYSRSEYKSPKGILLSYYKHDYDSNGNMKSIRAFNGVTDEFLRIERFEYNAKNQRIVRDIRNSADQVQRKYGFTFDGFDNETSMNVQYANGEVLFEEEYKITKYDDQKRWLEKWGFYKNEPNSYRERTFIK